MEISAVHPIPVNLERTTISNTAHPGAEAHVQKDFKQPPVLPVVDVHPQTRGNDTSTERKVEWAQQDRRPIYRVVERESGEVISQIPSEQVLRLARQIDAELHGDNQHAAVDVRS